MYASFATLAHGDLFHFDLGSCAHPHPAEVKVKVGPSEWRYLSNTIVNDIDRRTQVVPVEQEG